MREYQTTGIVRVNCGYIGLDIKQANARKTMIKDVEPGIYEVVRHIEFKAGERLRLVDPDKITLSQLICLDKDDIPEPVKKTAPKKSSAKKVPKK